MKIYQVVTVEFESFGTTDPSVIHEVNRLAPSHIRIDEDPNAKTKHMYYITQKGGDEDFDAYRGWIVMNLLCSIGFEPYAVSGSLFCFRRSIES